MLNLTVIIPTYNRVKILEITLNSFLNINTKEISWELIVVDNNSNDNTASIVKKFQSILPLGYVFEKTQGKNFALNTAIKKSKGEVLVFTDDDVLVDRNWLSEIFSSTQRYPDSKVFGGKILPQFPEGTPEWIKNSYYSAFVYAIHDPPQGEGVYLKATTPGGANCWVQRCVFDDGNMYDANIGPKGSGRISGSELEYFTRLLIQGITPVYIPSAVVIHRIQKFQTQKKYLLKRSYASGRGFVYIKIPDNSRHILGVPRYLLRQILESSVKAFICFITFDTKKYFEHMMTVAHRLGCIKQYRINNRQMI